MKHKTLKYISVFLILLSTASCKKFLDIAPPREQLVHESVFTSEAAAEAAVIGLYAMLADNGYNMFFSGTSIYGGLSADELHYFLGSGSQEEFESNSLSPLNSTLSYYFWSPAYKNIYHANAIIDGLNTSVSISPAVKNNLLGETKFLRALNYFYLANLFGDVPLVTSTNYEANATKPRDPRSSVYQFVIEELVEAKELLSADYISPERARVNKWAAAALLARAYLFTQEWAKAEAEATAIITSGMYSPLPALDQVFLKSSKETIWQIMPLITGTNTYEGYLFIPSATSYPSYVIKPGLLSAFETGDQRKQEWIGTKLYQGQYYSYPRKYRVKVSGGQPWAEYYVALRLAEQYLIRAESRIMQGKLTKALEDINTIRSRAGLPDATAGTAETAMDVIRKERRLELMFEWGHRWFDLGRWPGTDNPQMAMANEVLQPIKADWQPTDILYPIPQTEINTNPYLLQNPGY